MYVSIEVRRNPEYFFIKAVPETAGGSFSNKKKRPVIKKTADLHGFT